MCLFTKEKEVNQEEIGSPTQKKKKIGRVFII